MATAPARPTIHDLVGDNHFAALARSHWLDGGAPVRKAPASVVNGDLWDALARDNFAPQSLLLLEQLQALDRFLWPGYAEGASDRHVMLVALLVGVKRREGVDPWAAFAARPELFPAFFRRVLQLAVDGAVEINIRTQLVAFVIVAFQSLDVGIVRRECAALVSIGVWHDLHSEDVRRDLLGRSVQMGKAWRAAGKRYDTADGETRARLRAERSWLCSLVLHLVDRLYDASSGSGDVAYCERVVELLADLQSQLPTRRYVNTLLADLNILSVITLSPRFADESNYLLRDLTVLLQHYMAFPIEDHSGRELPAKEDDDKHDALLVRLQRVALEHFKDKLTILALSNLKSLASREDLQGHLTALTDDELTALCSHLQLRTEYPAASLLVRDRRFYLDVLVSRHERKASFRRVVRGMAVLPTEDIVYQLAFDLTENYDGSSPLALPRLNLQYLTISDFLWRSFILYRCESFYEVRKHIEDTTRRIQPRLAGSTVRFDGFSKMAIPISKPAIVNVGSPNVGAEFPSVVEAEVEIDVSRFTPGIRREWDTLRQDDVVYLVAAAPPANARTQTNGGSNVVDQPRPIKHIRCAEIIRVLDEDGRPLRKDNPDSRPRKRRLLVKLDARAYHADKQAADSGNADVYDSINLVIRRRGRENNFKPILESIKELVLSETQAPSWLQEVFLGYSDPNAASYKNMPSRILSIDYLDTFLDWPHLVESFPGQTAQPATEPIAPPFVVETEISDAPESRPTKKRRKEKTEPQGAKVESLKVNTYKPPNRGPYPSDAPLTNQIRFTATQVAAITSGMQPGLSVIVGPPGTGKTDVTTQIVSNLYHNFPQQRTLLVAHSNQALNQLFQKITALDIDERHLLRLGHGEEELETSTDYSKGGRIDSLMERSSQYLTEVHRLAASIGAPGAHGNSCETAEYFRQVYITPAWKQFWEAANAAKDPSDIATAFPFHGHFSDAPQPLFPKDASKAQVLEIAQGCERHLDHLFSTLADTRPFELLRSQRDKANYLLLHSARIVAMTSTHAAMRRSEIASLGFHYDNIIMEEAAQITEIESFITLALQAPKNNDMPLQRVVLVGDHLQNSPVVQNEAFRTYANLEQSLFLRLVRLGVPTVTLNAQGRARPSIAALYAWRYPSLTNLPLTCARPEYTLANPGLAHVAQFIDVPDYKSRGESSPSPHFIQNLGEAEYAVALYQYLRLLGYPAARISILAAYAGQRALIRDVLAHRCRANPLFGAPRAVSTIDRYQGEQNDMVILSLVRTERAGYLRDLRRVTVALSRARLGLYVLGRRALFEGVLELRPVLAGFFAGGRGDRLVVVPGETYGGGTTRREGDAVEGVEMVGVEHLGKYVFEMTNAKVESLRKGEGVLEEGEGVVLGSSDEEDEGVVVAEEEREWDEVNE